MAVNSGTKRGNAKINSKCVKEYVCIQCVTLSVDAIKSFIIVFNIVDLN